METDFPPNRDTEAYNIHRSDFSMSWRQMATFIDSYYREKSKGFFSNSFIISQTVDTILLRKQMKVCHSIMYQRI